MSTNELSRRALLQAAGATALLGMLGCEGGDDRASSRPRADGSWTNWSGGQTPRPKTWLIPANEPDLVSEVRRARGTVRVVGAGHSFSPLVATDDVLVSLDEQYAKVDYRELFATVEPIFRKHGGRPHWGKLHTLGAAELAELYPQWDAFQAVRRRLDPDGKFLNDHLRHCVEAA